MPRTTRRVLLLVAAAALTLAAAAPARASFFKLGVAYSATDRVVDTSDSQWMAGFGSDAWLNESFALGFEVDFTHTRTELDGVDDDLDTFYIYPYLNAKLRIPTPGFQLYGGGGLGYSPIITQFDGRAHQIGGMGLQLFAGVDFHRHHRHRGPSFFVEAQYKTTDVRDDEARLFGPETGSYDLFTLYGGIHF